MYTFHTFVTPVAINIPRQVPHAWNVKRKNDAARCRLSQAAARDALLCLYLAIETAQGLLIIRVESRNLGEVDKSRSREG